MTTEAEYRERISKHDWDGLIDLWEAIEAENTPEWGSGKALEYLVLRAFQLNGAEVRWPYSVRMDGQEVEQIDGVIYTQGIACLIECKDKSTRVNIEPIAKLRNQLLRRPGAVIGSVFSRKGFTDPAMTLARFSAPQTILLWTGEEVHYVLEKKCICRGLITKYRVCVELGLPDYNIRVEDLV